MGKKILFFQRSFIPFFKLHLCYPIKAKMAACQLPGLQLQRQGRLKHARVSVCVCVCVCMCFIKSWTVKATTLDLLMEICFTLVLCVHAHTPIGTLICLFRSMHVVLHMTQMLLTVGWNDGWMWKAQLPSHCLIWLQTALHGHPDWLMKGIRGRTDGRWLLTAVVKAIV